MNKRVKIVFITINILVLISFIITYFIVENIVLVLLLFLNLIILNGFCFYLFKYFDHMDDYRNKYLTNLTHSIRTPLSVMKGRIDLYNIDPKLLDSKEFLNEIVKVDLLVTSMLEISVAKEMSKVKFEIFNLSELVDIQCNKVKSILNHNNIKLIIDIKDDVIIKAHFKHIAMILATLLENSQKYAGKYIEVILTSTSVFINNDTVLDDGCYNNLFERFSRNNTTAGGYGVGLSIVKDLCDINKLNCSAYCKEMKFTIKIEFEKKHL